MDAKQEQMELEKPGKAASAEIIVVTDRSLRITSVRRSRSARLASRDGVESVSGLVGTYLPDHIVDIGREEALAVCQTILAGKTFENGERSFRKVVVKPGFGSERWTLVMGPNTGEDGRVEGVVFARYRSSEPLCDLPTDTVPNRIYECLVENAEDVIVLLDKEGLVSFANKRVERWPGLSVEDLVGSNMGDIIHPDDFPRCQDAVRNLLVTREPQTDIDFRVVSPEGEVCYLVANASLATWGDDPQILAVCRDVTDSVELNEKLMARNRALSALSEIVVALSSAGSLDEALQGALDKILSAVESSKGAILLSGPDGNLTTRAYSGIEVDEESLQGTGIPEYIRSLCEELDDAVIVPDVGTDARLTPRIREFATELGVESVVAITLRCGAQARAVLLISVNAPGDLTVEQMELVDLAAGMLGPAIENASLRAEERKKSAQLQASAKETQHRVKNNLQMIAGLLSMSENDGASGERAVRRSLRLVRAIASVQELLGEGVLSERAELGGCLEKTARSVLVSTGGERSVDLLVDGGDFPISPESATAVCIIVSELVSNCVEHAFRDRESGHIRIAVDKDGDETVIEVADDGIGLPPDFRVDEIGMSSSGLGLASALASYGLGGRLEVVGAGNGTRAMLRF